MHKNVSFLTSLAMTSCLLFAAATARADDDRLSACRDVPSHAALRGALEAARAQANGGFNLEMWATVVNRDGVVCAVAFTGNNRGDQWPGSRAISLAATKRRSPAHDPSCWHWELEEANCADGKALPSGDLLASLVHGPSAQDRARLDRQRWQLDWRPWPRPSPEPDTHTDEQSSVERFRVGVAYPPTADDRMRPKTEESDLVSETGVLPGVVEQVARVITRAE